MTPPNPVAEIAREAAEAILSPIAQSRSIERRLEGQTIEGDNDYPKRLEAITALILSAAAKMVQQSGAVDALEKWDDESAVITPPDQKDFVDVQMSPEAYEALYAALQSLRSITGEAGEWPVSSPSPKTAPLGLESFFSWVVIWFWQSWSQCP